MLSQITFLKIKNLLFTIDLWLKGVNFEWQDYQVRSFEFNSDRFLILFAHLWWFKGESDILFPFLADHSEWRANFDLWRIFNIISDFV